MCRRHALPHDRKQRIIIMTARSAFKKAILPLALGASALAMSACATPAGAQSQQAGQQSQAEKKQGGLFQAIGSVPGTVLSGADRVFNGMTPSDRQALNQRNSDAYLRMLDARGISLRDSQQIYLDCAAIYNVASARGGRRLNTDRYVRIENNRRRCIEEEHAFAAADSNRARNIADDIAFEDSQRAVVDSAKDGLSLMKANKERSVKQAKQANKNGLDGRGIIASYGIFMDGPKNLVGDKNQIAQIKGNYVYKVETGTIYNTSKRKSYDVVNNQSVLVTDLTGRTPPVAIGGGHPMYQEIIGLEDSFYTFKERMNSYSGPVGTVRMQQQLSNTEAPKNNSAIQYKGFGSLKIK